MSLLKKLAGETAVYGISSILGRLLNYVLLTPYLTRAFSTEEYGVISDLYAYVALLSVLFLYRMETALFRFATKNETKAKAFSTISIMLLVSTFIFSAGLMIFLPQIAEISSYQNHPEYIYLFIAIMAIDTISAVPFAQLRLQNRPLKFAGLKMMNILVNVGALFFFLEYCPLLLDKNIGWVTYIYHEENRLMYVFLANLVASLITFLPFLNIYQSIRNGFDRLLAWKMLKYAAPLVVSALAGIINQFIGTPMLKYMGGGSISQNLSDVGIFNAAAKIAVLMTLFTQAFNYASEPFFFRNSEQKNSELIFSEVARIFTMIGSVAFLGILSYIDVIGLLIGPNFRSGLHILPLLLLAYLFLGLFYSFSIWYKLEDKTHIGGKISLIGTLITILLNIALIPKFGILGPAIAAFVCYFFMAVAAYGMGRFYSANPINYPIGKMAAYLGGAILGYFGLVFFPTFLPNHLTYRILLGSTIFSLYLMFLFSFERKEIMKWMKQINFFNK